MKIAIDKDSIKEIKDLSKDKYIYVFDDEPLEELIKLNIQCIHNDYICELKDFKYYRKKDYKFAIIIPNCNNDHR